MSNSSDYIDNILSVSLEKVVEKHALSIRAYNACYGNGLTNLGLILEFWHQNRSFSSFRNIGIKTEEELSEVCLFYVSKISELIATNNFAITEDIPISAVFYGSFSERQESTINSFIQNQFKRLSESAKNALNLHLKKSIDFESIRHKLIVKNIRNIRGKTIQELSDFVNAIEINRFF